MRKLLALLLTTLLLLPIQASAASDTLWDDARAGVDGGTIGGISINLSNSTTQETISTELRNLPSIVEVYTATWCFNCIDSEHALDEAIGDTDVPGFTTTGTSSRLWTHSVVTLPSPDGRQNTARRQ